MKIGVVGTFIRDHIFPWRGPDNYSIGGLFFTVSYLANLLGPEDEVLPVCFAGYDLYDELLQVLSRHENVNAGGLFRSEQENTAVRLTYTGPQQREEVTTAAMPALEFEQLSLLSECDAVIVNLITGSDVQLAGLQQFRRTSTARIYLDFHSHALGINKEGKRFYNRPADWQAWVQAVDVLQLNEMEARTLAGFSAESPEDSLLQFAEELLSFGPSICHITLAERGSLLAFKTPTRVVTRRFAARKVEKVVDIIGCGDAFEAAFMVSYLRGKSVERATEQAHRVAAANCAFVGSSGIERIQSLAGEISATTEDTEN